MKIDRDAPIGVFDSGVGGLTVAREIMRNLPSEKIVYFGDTARVPHSRLMTIIPVIIESRILFSFLYICFIPEPPVSFCYLLCKIIFFQKYSPKSPYYSSQTWI